MDQWTGAGHVGKRKKVRSTPFREKNGKVPFNASGVALVGPGRFVFIDNRDPGALFEFALDDDGAEVGRIRRRPLVGVTDGMLQDPEGLASVESQGDTYLVIGSSLGVAGADGSGRKRVYDGLVRVRYNPDGDLHAEAMHGFRAWLLTHEPSLAVAGDREPDAGGLNIEGLAWDPRVSALVLGLRGPINPGRIAVVAIRVGASTAPWTTASLEASSILHARIPRAGARQGVRDLTYDERTGEFLILLGRTISRDDEPFQLCTWNGCDDDVQLLDVAFHRSMKPEGITTFSSGGENKLLIVDDDGGYAVLG
ncbi:DUF3616 domain-containing protein [Nocardia sp. 348MFTsu5.1]|uniref:DUF3616 domain-containing protein n=1 Tax=Nocardia sp. 348MFTsu5.1 TaxID=1172185 RepID=UPI00036BE75D|nr:DUF3616 domain-containing protein [Nocardia sp. 348MFTsu5.1]